MIDILYAIFVQRNTRMIGVDIKDAQPKANKIVVMVRYGLQVLLCLSYYSQIIRTKSWFDVINASVDYRLCGC